MAFSAFDLRHLSNVRIWNRQQPVGVGFVVGPRHIITCAHVVLASLGDGDPARSSGGEPIGTVLLDSMAADGIPPTGVPALLEARVRSGGWLPRDLDGGGDIALLELSPGHSLPRRAIPVQAARIADGQAFSAFGVTEGRDGRGRRVFLRKVVEGRLKGFQDDRRYLLGSETEDDSVRAGCSGAAVWTPNGDGVVGMIVDWQERSSGVMIPVSVLREMVQIESADRAVAPGEASDPGRTATASELLLERLYTFDREPQRDHFETVVSRTWDGARRPLLCMVGGLPADLPRACRDKLRVHLGGRFADMEICSDRLRALKLPWPDRKRFNVADELEALKNGIKAALKAKGGNDPDLLRHSYNGQLGGMVFFSEILHEVFSRDHEALLAAWKDFWQALGAAPFDKPFAHFLLFTFRSGDGKADEDRRRFYESKFGSDGSQALGRLPILTPFKADDVVDWLDSLSEDDALDPGLLRHLRFRASEAFPAERISRLDSLETWLRAVASGEGR
jgi:hypothetical protein